MQNIVLSVFFLSLLPYYHHLQNFLKFSLIETATIHAFGHNSNHQYEQHHNFFNCISFILLHFDCVEFVLANIFSLLILFSFHFSKSHLLSNVSLPTYFLPFNFFFRSYIFSFFFLFSIFLRFLHSTFIYSSYLFFIFLLPFPFSSFFILSYFLRLFIYSLTLFIFFCFFPFTIDFSFLPFLLFPHLPFNSHPYLFFLLFVIESIPFSSSRLHSLPII